ncbi:MAG: class I SAM-dependent methyltransferase [Candidatus Nanoarchaeia archaeon]|nr:class I SAM-dependent methyltransferase [Candidatus Nanoarchaeia archaeon]MDD5358124.1 class I SAM-dependent methyltransferase [Candidatus Nanoarchaeia archaeon]MDD5589311.1 class I SAM-dependent methyltransferase [Candidatus Nanoarchaeia archaeon]
MESSIKKRNNCRLCNGGLEKMFSLAPTPPGDKYLPEKDFVKKEAKYPLNIVSCNKCGLLQLEHTVNPKILYRDYIYLTSNSLGLVEHFKKYAETSLEEIDIPEQSLVIDIGCNDGTLLNHFKTLGMKPLGIEPAKKCAEITRGKGIPVIEDFLNRDVVQKVSQEYGKAKIITANNVFANIDNLGETIRNIKDMLSPTGVFIFETGYMPDAIANNIFDNLYHEHLSYFSVGPLKSFFESEDMEIFDIKHLPTKGGSIRGMVQFKGEEKKISDSVKYQLDFEENMKIRDKKTFKGFYERIKKEGEEIKRTIKEIKSKGKIVAGYGASVGVTTMLYEWDMGGLIDFLIDDNQMRHNLLSPGLGLRVYPPTSLKEKKPEAVCIFAWRYSDPIINKNKEYIKEGGRFIVPFSNSDITKTY